ncbi:MAG TPA: hypothetical protein VM261_04270 [Kofleriaceae bacterium]|nr:hypothetical protein [Kofleriaceae bacterium]
MPLPDQTINQLASQTAPIIHFLVSTLVGQAPGGLPALTGGDLASVTAWWASLSDAQALAVLARINTPEAMRASQELAAPAPAPPAPAPPAPSFPKEPGWITDEGSPHVDRQDIWDGLLTLLQSQRRILHVRGESKVGKSRAVDLVPMFLNSDPQPNRIHLIVEYDFDDKDFEVAMKQVFAALGNEAVPDREGVSSTDENWQRRVATVAHRTSRSRPDQSIVWFVFDHVERLLKFSEYATFFNHLVELVVQTRNQVTGPRLVLIDRRHVQVNPDLRTAVLVEPLTQRDVANYLRRKNPALDMATAEADALAHMTRAREATKETPALYMDRLKGELA